MTRRPTTLPRPMLPVGEDADFASDGAVAAVKPILIRVSPQVRKKLKHLAVDLDRTTQSLLTEAIDLLFEKHLR